MMKKYNLYLKEEHRGKQAIRYPEITGHNILGSFKSHYMLVGERLDMDFILPEAREVYKATTFTQQEIDNLPHSFVKLFDLIEVKEELYYIEMPHTVNKFLNEDLRDGEVVFYDSYEDSNFKTRFTLEYIEDTYPEYKQFAVKVEEINNE